MRGPWTMRAHAQGARQCKPSDSAEKSNFFMSFLIWKHSQSIGELLYF